MTNNDVIAFASSWKTKYPLDYWWRQKHNIAFGSKAHMKASPIFMRIEFEEDFLFKNKREVKQNDYIVGEWIVEKQFSLEELMDKTVF